MLALGIGTLILGCSWAAWLIASGAPAGPVVVQALVALLAGGALASLWVRWRG